MKNIMKRICFFVSVTLALAFVSTSNVAYAVTYKVDLKSTRLVVTPGSGTQNDCLDLAFGVSSDGPLDIGSILDAQPEFSLSYFDGSHAGAPITFYEKVIPRGSLATKDGIKWSLTDAGRSQTGLETLVLTKTTMGFTLEFLDAHTSLPSVDYSLVQICITIGADSGCGQATLQPSGNTWTVNN